MFIGSCKCANRLEGWEPYSEQGELAERHPCGCRRLRTFRFARLLAEGRVPDGEEWVLDEASAQVVPHEYVAPSGKRRRMFRLQLTNPIS